MATIRTRTSKKGNQDSFLINFRLNRVPKTLSLGSKYSRRQAEEILIYIEKIVNLIETGGVPDKKTLIWVESMPPDLRERFERAGLVEKSKKVTVKELWELFQKDWEYGRKESTLRTYITIKKRFLRYFDEDVDPNEIIKEDCVEWLNTLEMEYADASLAGCIQRCTTVFRWAVENGYVQRNPFIGIPRRSFVNPKKRQYIPIDWYKRLLDACPSQSWRTLLAFCRIGGLRNPSETQGIKWTDVNWAESVIKVTSPKTEHHRGKDSRNVPLFPELREELERQFEDAKPGGIPYVIERDLFHNQRKKFEMIIFQAGLQQWPDLFQNLRRSRDNELSSQFPAYISAEWMGHSPAIARTYYLFATREDVAKATRTRQAEEQSVDQNFRGQEKSDHENDHVFN